MIRRIMAFVLSAVLVVGMTPAAAFAANEDDQAEQPRASLASAEFFSFIYIDSAEVQQGALEQVAVGFADASIAELSPVLHYVNVTTGAQSQVQPAASVEGTVRYDLDELPLGEYKLASVSYVPAEGAEPVEVAIPGADEGQGAFSVVAAVESEESGVDVVALTDGTEDAVVDQFEQNLEAAYNGQDVQAVLNEMTADADFMAKASGMTVVLDPGHGGFDSGAVGNGLREATLNLKIAQYCKTALESAGACKVVMTRNSDTSLRGSTKEDLEARAALAKSVGAGLFVSFHINAGGGNGAEVWVQNTSSWKRELHDESYELGKAVLDKLVALGLTRRGVYTRNSEDNRYPDGSVADYLSVLRNNRLNGIPAVLIEHGFIDNGHDASYLSNENNLKAMGQADAKAIMDWVAPRSVSLVDIQAFVTRLYKLVLGRTPDEAGMNAQCDAMLAGTPAGQIAMNFFVSKEFKNKSLSNADRVKTAYKAMFNRDADASGLSDWTNKLDSGCSIAAVIAGFVESQEFVALCGKWKVRPGDASALRTALEPRDQNVNATAFVARLYNLVLSRTPDTKGLNTQCKALMDGMTAGQLAMNIMTSTEFSKKSLTNKARVKIAYQSMLDRAADSSGLKDWTEKLDSGCSMGAIVAGFVESKEFSNLCKNWGVNRGDAAALRKALEPRDQNVNATAFVHRLYTLVLGRTPDTAGLNTQCKALIDGMPAASLANNIFASPEFTKGGYSNDQKVTIAYKALLNRDPDAAGKKDWVKKLDAGMTLANLVAGFANSKEFGNLCSKYGLVQGSLPYREFDPVSSSKMAIMGKSEAAWVNAMVTYFNKQKGESAYPSSVYKECPTIRDFCQTLYEEASAEGVRADVVFCQSMHETGWLQFGNLVNVKQRNFAGLGATGPGHPGETFPSVRIGLRAQVQHLKAYASTKSLVKPVVDTRFGYVTRGCAPCVEDLSGRWAVPGVGYGELIVKMCGTMRSYL